MTDEEQQAHRDLYNAVAARLTADLLKFARELQGKLSYTEVGEILVGCGSGLVGLDLGPAGTVEFLHRTAAGIEARSVNPDPHGRTN